MARSKGYRLCRERYFVRPPGRGARDQPREPTSAREEHRTRFGARQKSTPESHADFVPCPAVSVSCLMTHAPATDWASRVLEFFREALLMLRVDALGRIERMSGSRVEETQGISKNEFQSNNSLKKCQRRARGDECVLSFRWWSVVFGRSESSFQQASALLAGGEYHVG